MNFKDTQIGDGQWSKRREFDTHGINYPWQVRIYPDATKIKLTHSDIVQWLSFGDNVQYYDEYGRDFSYLSWKDYPSERRMK